MNYGAIAFWTILFVVGYLGACWFILRLHRRRRTKRPYWWVVFINKKTNLITWCYATPFTEKQSAQLVALDCRVFMAPTVERLEVIHCTRDEVRNRTERTMP